MALVLVADVALVLVADMALVPVPDATSPLVGAERSMIERRAIPRGSVPNARPDEPAMRVSMKVSLTEEGAY